MASIKLMIMMKASAPNPAPTPEPVKLDELALEPTSGVVSSAGANKKPLTHCCMIVHVIQVVFIQPCVFFGLLVLML